MEECIYAIHNNKVEHLISNISVIKRLEEIYHLIDVASSLRDTEIIWYIQEKKSRELPILREEILRKKGCSPCNPLTKLKQGLKSQNRDLILLARDVIETPIDIRYLKGYTSQEYSQLLKENQRMREKSRGLLPPSPRNS